MTCVKQTILATVVISLFAVTPYAISQGQTTLETVASKCDENTALLKSLVKSQQEIISQLKEIREELNIVKIRATR